jgi:phage terminase large subunit-like protein
MVVALADDQNYYLVDIVRDKFNPTQRVDALIDLHRAWSEHFGRPLKVGYESYGLQSDLHYIEQRQKDESYNFPLIPLGGKMAKEDRIARLIPDMENLRWYFPRHIDYKDTSGRTFELVAEMVKGEMLTFPVSKHDDCLDAMSRIYDEDIFARFPAPKASKRKELMGADYSDMPSHENSNHWINT